MKMAFDPSCPCLVSQRILATESPCEPLDPSPGNYICATLLTLQGEYGLLHALPRSTSKPRANHRVRARP